MSRLAIPATVDATPAASQPMLLNVKKQLGMVPNMYRLIGQNPAALEGLQGLQSGLGHGLLDAKLRNRLSMTVAESNGCDYCLSAHTAVGHMLKLDDAELTANRDAHSSDLKSEAALRFAARVVAERGRVSDADLQAVKAAGFGDAEVIEIVLHVALNTLTNYVNIVAATDIDFPVVTHKEH